MAARFLIVNADDLGHSAAVNAGIAAAHRRGIVTSASLMVRRPAADEAVALAEQNPALAIGLHLDVGRWEAALGEWTVAASPGEVERECRAQLAAFRELLGRDPTHLDSHHHTHAAAPVAAVAEEIAVELGVPLRGEQIRCEFGFFGQRERGVPFAEGISVRRLIGLIEALPPSWTELVCHPGIGVAAGSSYTVEREREVEALCDASVRAALDAAGVALRSFAELGPSPCDRI